MYWYLISWTSKVSINKLSNPKFHFYIHIDLQWTSLHKTKIRRWYTTRWRYAQIISRYKHFYVVWNKHVILQLYIEFVYVPLRSYVTFLHRFGSAKHEVKKEKNVRFDNPSKIKDVNFRVATFEKKTFWNKNVKKSENLRVRIAIWDLKSENWDQK